MSVPHRPKAVVFDLGKVLLDFDYGKTVDRIKAQCTLGEPELRALFTHCDLFNQLESGQISVDGYFAEVQKRTGYSGPFLEFEEYFGDIFTEIPEMVAWNEELRRRGIPTYILSNTSDLSIRYVKKRFPFFKNFTGYVFSHEAGVMKPGARIYEAVEEMSKLRGADLFFLDDKEENVHGAAARGWQAVVHGDPAKSLAIARELGL